MPKERRVHRGVCEQSHINNLDEDVPSVINTEHYDRSCVSLYICSDREHFGEASEGDYSNYFDDNRRLRSAFY